MLLITLVALPKIRRHIFECAILVSRCLKERSLGGDVGW